jgi:hypothetical protein
MGRIKQEGKEQDIEERLAGVAQLNSRMKLE